MMYIVAVPLLTKNHGVLYFSNFDIFCGDFHFGDETEYFFNGISVCMRWGAWSTVVFGPYCSP
jgi:hypothetical protein